jgi:uncharacterized protein (TIGR03066 family)
MVKFIGTACLILGLSSCSGKSDKDKGGSPSPSPSGDGSSTADKIVSTWEPTTPGVPSDPTAIEFTKDGKVKMTFKGRASEESKYQVEGDMITMTHDKGKRTIKIMTLTDTKLVLEGDEGKPFECKKK